jgi:hypothetical protein
VNAFFVVGYSNVERYVGIAMSVNYLAHEKPNPHMPMKLCLYAECIKENPLNPSSTFYPLRGSGTLPSTTETGPTLGASTEPLSIATAEMTSDGSSKCQLARVCFELAPTVTEKTWSLGSFELLRDLNMSANFNVSFLSWLG